jgi:tRNA (cmo5U34)-methyltransferase
MAVPPTRDDLFARTEPGPGEFRFDDAVAQVLPDMLRRSIPGYHALLELLGVLAARVVTPDSHVYDLGCSLGAVSLSIRHALGARQARIIAVDKSAAMVARCRDAVALDSGLAPVEVHEADVTEFPFEQASLIVLNFTLQFVAESERLGLLRRARAALGPAGVLVLSEKTRASSPEEELRLQSLHDAFRQANGYSELEMSRKRQALEQVLVADTVETHEARLRLAGFVPTVWFRSLHFVSWIAEPA